MSKKSHILPIGVYLCGLGALLLSDIIATKYLSTQDISTWAEIRSLIGICSVLCLVGLDQAFVRHPESSRKLFKALTIQIPLIATAISIVAFVSGLTKDILSIIGLCIGSAGALALFQYYRIHNFKSASQLAQQLWKIFALLAVVVFALKQQSISLSNSIAIAMIGALALTAAPLTLERFRPQKNLTSTSMASLYAIGLRFLITSLLLSLAIYAEQLVVSYFGGKEYSALYFTHATYFLFPISVANGYIAFNLAPWIKNNHAKFTNTLQNNKLKVLAIVVFYAILTTLAGWLAWIALAPAISQPNALLILLLFTISILRTLYLFPGGYFGVFGKPSHHDKLIRLQIFSLLISMIVFCLVFYGLAVNILYSTAVASLTNWLLRTISGFSIIKLIENENN